jgi:uncharacterized protein YceK
MKTMNSYFKMLSLGAAILLVLTGCGTVSTTLQGRETDPASRIILAAGGPHAGSWAAPELAVTFDYNWDPSILDISGAVVLDNYIRLGHDRLVYLDLRVNYIDAEGFIIGSDPVLYVNYDWMTYDQYPFARSLTAPVNTAAIAFSYMGRAWESDGEPNRGSVWNFREFPK